MITDVDSRFKLVKNTTITLVP